MNHDLPERLAKQLSQPLPGWRAQVRLQPELSFGRHRGPAPASVRPAAVLVLLYPHEDRWHIPLILRPAHMQDHASQVSLPGGTIEPGENSREAALRELTEELGPPAETVEILGVLSDLYLFASNYQITPWVGMVRHRPQWQPNACEVEQLIEMPLTHLLDDGNLGTIQRVQRGLTFSAPCYHWESLAIWGATSMVLAELAAVLLEATF